MEFRFFPSKMPWQTNKPEKFNQDGKLTPEVGVIKKWGIIKKSRFPNEAPSALGGATGPG